MQARKFLCTVTSLAVLVHLAASQPDNSSTASDTTVIQDPVIVIVEVAANRYVSVGSGLLLGVALFFMVTVVIGMMLYNACADTWRGVDATSCQQQSSGPKTVSASAGGCERGDDDDDDDSDGGDDDQRALMTTNEAERHLKRSGNEPAVLGEPAAEHGSDEDDDDDNALPVGTTDVALSLG